MSSWDAEIFTEDANIDFLDDLAELEEDEIVEAVFDACVLGRDSTATDDDRLNALAAATIAAIWAGAPYADGDTVEQYPFISQLIGAGDEEHREIAAALLEAADTEEDIDPFLEALS